MGNNLEGGGLLLPSCNNEDGDGCSFHLQLGTSVTIDITTKEELLEDYNGIRKTRKVSYTVDGLTCDLHLIQKKYDSKFLSVVIRDDMFPPDNYLEIWIEGDNFGLSDFHFGLYRRDVIDDTVLTKTTSVTSHPGRGGVTTKTKVYLYGSGSRGGLIVVKKKKRKEGWWRKRVLYKITVAHYYAASTGNVFSKTKTDVGLSMVAKIKLLNGRGDFEVTSVEGPVRHPAAVLFYMFEQVFKTGVWKPTSCPHCANTDQIQRHCESEDSDNNNNINNVSAARPISNHGPNASVLGNNGVFRGNHNGNLIVRNLFLGERL